MEMKWRAVGVVSVIACGGILAAVGSELAKDELGRPIAVEGDYRPLRVLDGEIHAFGEMHNIAVEPVAWFDKHGRDLLIRGSRFGAEKLRLNRFLGLESGRPLYAPGVPVEEADVRKRGLQGPRTPTDYRVEGVRIDVDGDGVDDRLRVTYREFEHAGMPYEKNQWNADDASPYAGPGKLCDIFGRWLAPDGVIGLEWSKGDAGAKFSDWKTCYTEVDGRRPDMPFAWRGVRGGVATVLSRAGQRWMVVAANVDEIVALPLSVQDGEIVLGKARPLLESGLQLPRTYWASRLLQVDFDLDGEPEIALGANPGTFEVLKGHLPGQFRSMGNALQKGGDVWMETLTAEWRMDWDHDGYEDVIAGDASGYLEFWRGTEDPFAYHASVPFTVDGEPVHVVAGHDGSVQGPTEKRWGYLKPLVGKWGDREVIITVDIRGDLMLFGRANGASATELNAPIRFKFPTGVPFRVAMRSRGDFVRAATGFAGVPRDSLLITDLDGDLAVAVPDADGSTTISSVVKLGSADGGTLRVCGRHAYWGRGHVAFMDWDGDGALDLVFGTNGGACNRFFVPDRPRRAYLWLFRNEGDNGKPAFGRPREISFKDGRLLQFCIHCATPCPTDLNGDGKMDLLIGAENGKIYGFMREDLK